MSRTPGPWRTINDETFVTGTSERFLPVASIYGEDGGSKIDETMKANARLIAAAPDLLEAAQKMLEVKQLFGETWDELFCNCDPMYLAVEALEKAVAKAKGA